jgi:hypothetical protein
MCFSFSPRVFCSLLVFVTICGCGSVEEPPASTVKAEVPAVVAKPQAEKSAGPQDNAKPEEKAAEPEANLTEEAESAAYEPPYPDRENLFLAPKRSASNKTHGNLEQSVELLGFANVNGQKVILSINGIVVPMSEGTTQSGIEVISIQPPAVVLQRNRERWQAMLDN